MDKRDLVITAITNYNFNQIAPWVNSLDRSGFTGIKAVVAYNVDGQTLNELAKRGYSILAFQKDETNGNVTYPNKDFAIVVDRFLHYYLMLDNPQNAAGIRCVIATDAKDVIFQHNPSTYLDTLASRGFKLVASSEGLQYQHENWGANNLKQSFGPLMYEKHKENTIVNCGVLAGEFNTFLGLCKTIYLMSHGTVQHVPGGGGPDQAALNLIIRTPAYEAITDFVTHEYPWAAQLGTTMDPNKIDAYRPHITEPVPVFNESTGLVETPEGIPYAIVHQWDRVPEVKRAVEGLYR
jgi:hypothetical protein